jgi:hypothetical protein
MYASSNATGADVASDNSASFSSSTRSVWSVIFRM